MLLQMHVKLTLTESNTLQCYYKYMDETQQQSLHIQKRETKHFKRGQILRKKKTYAH